MSESQQDKCLQHARLSLEGLAVADSLGGFFEFNRAGNSHFIKNRKLSNTQWRFTDDTNMALSIFSILRQYGEIDQDKLANSFAEHYDRGRGYGRGVRALVSRMRKGLPWREISTQLFGDGSYGNGGAMRVAPLGAYFADDMDTLILNARLSTEITHAHPEGIAGAIAVAVAAAIAFQSREDDQPPSRQAFISKILPHIPDSDMLAGCERARDLPSNTTIPDAVQALGNGSQVTAQDTVPFVLFCAGQWLDDYEEAFWQTASGGGDVDTTCAMVGGIVSMYVGEEGIPDTWIQHREPLPDWAFEDVN